MSQTEFVATFLGKANLMVGHCDEEGVTLGPVRFPHDSHVEALGGVQRVQVLFRPEDVAVKKTEADVAYPILGQGTVDESDLTGSSERLRLRLAVLKGVRSIAPRAPFGADYVLVESIRSRHQAHRFPLRRGDAAWVGIRRIHALTHPGLSFLAVSDGSPQGEAALMFASELARLAHARTTVLSTGMDPEAARAYLERAREVIGVGPAALELRSGSEDAPGAILREAARQPYDLIIHGRPASGVVEMAESLLGAQENHLLLVPRETTKVKRVLICVAGGEPGKDDVLFAGRLIRHLGAVTTLMTIVPEDAAEHELELGERFLAAGARTISRLGLENKTILRRGGTREAIEHEVKKGAYDMVVLGAPEADRGGKVRLGGLMGGLLNDLPHVPVLVVRSRVAVAPES